MDLQQFSSAIEQICEEKGILKEKVIETIEMALAAAYKKDYGHKGQNIRACFDLKTGKVQMYQLKLVVDESMIKSEEEYCNQNKWVQTRPLQKSIAKNIGFGHGRQLR